MQYRTIEQMCSDAHSITLKTFSVVFLFSIDFFSYLHILQEH